MQVIKFRRNRLLRILLVSLFVCIVLFITHSQLDDETNAKIVNHIKQIIEIPVELSAYASHETNGDDDQIDHDYILQIIDEIVLEESVRENINPANPSKDWSIKINSDLKSVSSKAFIKGHPVTKQFFDQLLNLMHGNRLSFPLRQRMKMENGKTVIEPVLLYQTIDEKIPETRCKSFFYFPDNFIEDTTIKHKIVTDNLPDIDPSFYSGSGYVIVGGGKYSWFALLVIETLRKLGSKLPVEVIMPTPGDYEEPFCESILPNYNAKCVNIHDVFDADLLEKIKVTGYQYKSLALLASSFENAFLLDADTYPIINPDALFKSKLYRKYKMITWPDYWRRTTSPYFYQISGKEIGKRVRYMNDFHTDPKYYKIKNEDEDPSILEKKVSYHDREGTLPEWTTESGELLINKKVYFKALLLALYYNLEGQFGFYPLLSQGGAGEGDKETFVAAAHYFDLHYYQVNKKPDRTYGFYKFDELVDTTIIQYNPLQDFKMVQKINKEIDTEIKKKGTQFKYDFKTMFADKFILEDAEPMFYHVHETKMDPFNLVEIKATEDKSGNKLRNLGGDFPSFNFDLEQYLWITINKHLCKNSIDMQFFKDKDRSIVCQDFIQDHLDYLEKTSSVLTKKYDAKDRLGNLYRCEDLL